MTNHNPDYHCEKCRRYLYSGRAHEPFDDSVKLCDSCSKSKKKPSPSKKQKPMSLTKAFQVLLRAAENDVRGSGLGYRSTSDAWRYTVSDAWAKVWKHVYGWEPSESDYRNSGMTPPDQRIQLPARSND